MRFFVQTMYLVGALLLGFLVLVWSGVTVPGVGPLELRIVKSGSMEPTIQTGGVVFVRPASIYEAGEVITYQEPNTVIPTTHRIVDTYSEQGTTYFITKGDANETIDASAVPAAAVLGRVVFAVPFVGYLIDFARQPLGFALLIVVPALLIILSEIEVIRGEIRQRQPRRRSFVPQSVRGEVAVVIECETIEVSESVSRPMRMMEIGRPVRVVGARPVRRPAEPVVVPALASSNRNLFVPWLWGGVTGSFVLVVGIVSYATMTNALFSHTVASVGNVFQAGEFIVDEPDNVLELVPVQQCVNYTPRTIAVSLPLEVVSSNLPYELSVIGTPTGDTQLCGALQLSVGSMTPVSLGAFVYSTADANVTLAISGSANPGNRSCTFILGATSQAEQGALTATTVITVGDSIHNQCVTPINSQGQFLQSSFEESLIESFEAEDNITETEDIEPVLDEAVDSYDSASESGNDLEIGLG